MDHTFILEKLEEWLIKRNVDQGLIRYIIAHARPHSNPFAASKGYCVFPAWVEIAVHKQMEKYPLWYKLNGGKHPFLVGLIKVMRKVYNDKLTNVGKGKKKVYL